MFNRMIDFLLRWTAVVMVMLVALPVMAQEEATGKLVEFLMDPNTWAIIVTVGFTVWGLFKRDQAKKAEEWVRTWAPVFYNAVNEVARRTDSKAIDKAAEFLKLLGETAEGDGIKLTESLTKKALAVADASHFIDKTTAAFIVDDEVNTDPS